MADDIDLSSSGTDFQCIYHDSNSVRKGSVSGSGSIFPTKTSSWIMF
jgi:hypothetical protein